MNELKIDEERILNKEKSAIEMIKLIKEQTEIMTDKNQDIFSRQDAYSLIDCIFYALINGIDTHKKVSASRESSGNIIEFPSTEKKGVK